MVHGFDVRRKLKGFRVIIFALFIVMSFCLAYLQYDSGGEIHFLSSNQTLRNLEIADQEDLVMDPPTPSKGIVSGSFVNLSHLGIHPPKDSLPFPFQPFLAEQNIPILRC
jgi:hypothetical protein